jgi:hypothetical protein
MKKPKLEVNEQPQPRNIQRADIAPSDGFALVVDGHFKTQFAEKGAAMKAATELLAKYPMLLSKFTTHPRSHEPWLSSSKFIALQQR